MPNIDEIISYLTTAQSITFNEFKGYYDMIFGDDNIYELLSSIIFKEEKYLNLANALKGITVLVISDEEDTRYRECCNELDKYIELFKKVPGLSQNEFIGDTHTNSRR